MVTQDMKTVFMGTPDFAVPPLKALVEAGYEVAAVVTQPDKPKGRGKTLMPTPVKEEALMHEIPVYQPKRVRNNEEFLETLKEINPDIIDGEKESGVTIMQMGEGLDTGDMISQIVIPLDKEETGGSLFGKLAQAGAELLIKTLPSIEQGTAVAEKQPEESPTPYAAMITKQMGLLDFTKSAETLERLVRGMNPWPSAYTFVNGKTLKVWKSSVSQETSDAQPGTVILTDKAGIHVACKEGVLLLTEIQLEGKKRMDAETFLRGYHMEQGTVFTDHKE